MSVSPRKYTLGTLWPHRSALWDRCPHLILNYSSCQLPLSTIAVESADQELYALPCRFTSSSSRQLSLPSRSPSKIHSLFHYLSLDLFLLHAFSVSTLILVSLRSPPPALDSPKPLDLSSSFYPDRPLIFLIFFLLLTLFSCSGIFSFLTTLLLTKVAACL